VKSVAIDVLELRICSAPIEPTAAKPLAFAAESRQFPPALFRQGENPL
jgi:hypothetical protein